MRNVNYSSEPRLKITPLGGLGEIGKNMMALECGDDIIVIDAGVMFPESEMLGVDLVIPDTTYLMDKRDRIRAILLTHGHEDHVGGLPYIFPQIPAPIYGTRLTIGLASVKLREHGLLEDAEMHIFKPRDILKFGCFEVEPFHVNHSIPDGVGFAIHCPAGLIVHSGDFKFDHTPVDGELTDFATLAQMGDEGVLVLLMDSTRAESPGYTLSEQVVGVAFERVFREAEGRIIISTFASLISRMQLVVDTAARLGRRVAITGRSMINNSAMAQDLGYLKIPRGVLVSAEESNNLPDHEVVILTTGSQGEPTSGLARMANRDHHQITIRRGDTVVISATPIPGNEELINRTLDNLIRQGAHVLYDRIAQVHVTGHASQEELKLMIALLRPRHLVPIHGEMRHLHMQMELARSMGMTRENIFVIENGQTLDVGEYEARVVGKPQAGYVFVDGYGVGDVGTVVLRDRQHLSRDGFVIVVVGIEKQTGTIFAGPDIYSRGFVYEPDAGELIESSRDLVLNELQGLGGDGGSDVEYVHERIRRTLGKYYFDRTKRRPMILPIVMEV